MGNSFNIEAEASRLVREGKARDYYEACRLIARRPRRRRQGSSPIPPELQPIPKSNRLPYADN